MSQTVAEKIKAGTQKPTKGLVEAHERNVQIVKDQAAGLRSAAGRRELVNRVHAIEVAKLAQRAADEGKDAPAKAKAAAKALAEGFLGEDGETMIPLSEVDAYRFSGLSKREARAQADAFIEDNLANGLYAYSFEEQSDGSWVAVYVVGETEKPSYAAFDEWADTAEWHPVRAPQE